MPNIEFVSQADKIEDFNMLIGEKNWKLLYLLSGELIVTLNDKIYYLTPFSALIISPEDFYYVNADKNTDYKTFDFGLSKNQLYNLRGKVLKLGEEENKLFSSLCKVSQNDIFNKQSTLELCLSYCATNEGNLLPLEERDTGLFKKSIGIMNRHIMSTLSVDELADMLNISLSHLKRIFSKYANLGAHEYFLNLKINKAKELLLEGNSVTRVAKIMQFSSQAYFSYVFKRVTGISAKSFSLGKLDKKEPTVKRKPKPQPKQTYIRDLPDYLL